MKKYTITLQDCYSAAERTVSVSALNEDHARRKVEKELFEVITAIIEDQQPAQEPAQQPPEEPEYISRPVWTPAIKGRRAETWHRRYVSAWDLASMIDGENVTETEYNAALKLLDSIQRYALADAAEWERENSSEWYCNSAYHKDREKQLDKRRAALNTRLDRYGLKLENYGLYPTIISKTTRHSYYFLHYFD